MTEIKTKLGENDAASTPFRPATGIAESNVQDALEAVYAAIAAQIAAHEAEADPHPGYLTEAEGDAAYQPLDADLTSWAGVTRAAGFDTFVAAPSSANLASLVTGETGSGALVFGTGPTIASPTITTSPTAAGATWTDLGAVTTVDINGGTIDGATIGGASAAAVTGTTITATTGFMPDANDGAYLGQSGTAFSDLFLASGGVINWAAGDVTITHSANQLTFASGTVYSFDGGTLDVRASGSAPVAQLYRYDAHGSATDLGKIDFFGNDSGASIQLFGGIYSYCLNATAASEEATLDFYTVSAGTFAKRVTVGAGVQVGAPTGGDKGTGTLNAVAVYDDNTLLTDYVFDWWQDGALNPADAGNVKAEAFDPRWLDLDTYTDALKSRRALPAMPLRAEWTEDTRPSIGDLVQRLWETVEVQAVHIATLNERITALEHAGIPRGLSDAAREEQG